MRWFPYVSRERYEHETGLLGMEILELKEERERLIDFIASHSVGSAIYRPKPKEKPKEAGPDGTPVATDPFVQDYREAVRAVGRNPRKITDFISRKNTRRAEEKRQTVPTESYAMSQSDVENDIASTISEGQQAGQDNG